MSYLEQYFELIPSFPFVIQVALYFIFINAVLSISFALSIYLLRKQKHKAESIEEELYPKQRAFVAKILNNEASSYPDEISQQYQKEVGKLNKKTYPPLIAVMEDIIKEDPAVLSNKNYDFLIKGLRIEEYLFKKLSFSNTRTKLRTFQSLSILNLTAPDSSILPFTYSKNFSLKKESRNSYIGISNHDPFKFFDVSDNKLNYWDQINLMQQLEHHHKNNLPNFSRWIKYSGNKSQLTFIIKAVAHFKQTTAIPSLIHLLDAEDHEIRKEAILALGELRALEIEEELKTMYNDQPLICQNAIIEAVFMMKSGQSLDFLKATYQEVNNLETKKLIAEAIYTYNDEGKAYLQEMYETEKGFDKLILEHVKNPLIPLRFRQNRKNEAKTHQFNSMPPRIFNPPS